MCSKKEFRKKLADNSVVYLNLDSAVIGNFSYLARASPLLFDLIINVTKSIRVENSEKTVYDNWLVNSPNSDGSGPE
jgi:hypothetical protein